MRQIPVLKLAEAAEILGVSGRAAESALRHAGIKSGYPQASVEWLAANRPGAGARTDLKEGTMTNDSLSSAWLEALSEHIDRAEQRSIATGGSQYGPTQVFARAALARSDYEYVLAAVASMHEIADSREAAQSQNW